MKLYNFGLAPSPRRARMFLAEKGIDIPMVEINLRDFEHLTEDFKAVNPWCTVPVLETDDGTRIAEVTAIWRYLEEVQPDPPLLGRDALERALVEMWNRHAEFEGFYAVAECLRNTAGRLKDRALTGPHNVAQIESLGDRGRARVGWLYDELDARLADAEFIVGDQFTAADITTYCTIDFGGWVKIEIGPQRANLKRWYETVAARPSAEA